MRERECVCVWVWMEADTVRVVALCKPPAIRHGGEGGRDTESRVMVAPDPRGTWPEGLWV